MSEQEKSDLPGRQTEKAQSFSPILMIICTASLVVMGLSHLVLLLPQWDLFVCYLHTSDRIVGGSGHPPHDDIWWSPGPPTAYETSQAVHYCNGGFDDSSVVLNRVLLNEAAYKEQVRKLESEVAELKELIKHRE